VTGFTTRMLEFKGARDTLVSYTLMEAHYLSNTSNLETRHYNSGPKKGQPTPGEKGGSGGEATPTVKPVSRKKKSINAEIREVKAEMSKYSYSPSQPGARGADDKDYDALEKRLKSLEKRKREKLAGRNLVKGGLTRDTKSTMNVIDKDIQEAQIRRMVEASRRRLLAKGYDPDTGEKMSTKEASSFADRMLELRQSTMSMKGKEER
jgi:hypothetical protein